MADISLDTSGLACPIPILKTKNALAQMAAGGTLEVIATDPAAPRDFAAFCKATGHRLIDSRDADGHFVFVIAKTG